MKAAAVLPLLLLCSSASADLCWQQEYQNDWGCQTEYGPLASDDPASPMPYQGIGKQFDWYVQPTSLGYLLSDGGYADFRCANTNQLVVGHITLVTSYVGIDAEPVSETSAIYCQPPPQPAEIPWWELWSRNAACYYGFGYCYYDPWEWDYN